MKERYGEHIYFSELPGRSDVVCFKEFAYYVLKEKKKKSEETKENIIIAAGKIIKSEIREMLMSNETNPTTQDIRNIDEGIKLIPESLQLLLRFLIPNKIKQVAIGQCITQAARFRSVICPVPFGIGVQLEKTMGSKWLINHLCKLRFSISSDEILRYKHSAISESIEQDEDVGVTESVSFCQWAADNVDHNTITLTGKGTFHGMGIVSMSEKSRSASSELIKRLKNRLKNIDFTQHHNITIHQFHSTSEKRLAKIYLKPILNLRKPLVLLAELSYDFLWHSSRFLNETATPNWSGFMQDLTRMHEPKPKASITFIPIIDLNPNN